MTIRIRNQRPAELYTDPFKVLEKIDVDKSEDEYGSDVYEHISETFIKPMYIPINQSNPVTIEDTSSNPPSDIDEDTLHNAIQHLWFDDTLDVQLQEQVNDIYRQGIQYHAQNDWFFEEQLSIEALVRNQMPIPKQTSTQIVKYSASLDVIPAARKFLADNDEDSASEWFATLSAYTHGIPISEYLVVTVQSSDVFEELKQAFRDFMVVWQASGNVNQKVIKLAGDFDKIDLSSDLSSTIFMPENTDTETTDMPYSFNRMLMYILGHSEENSQHGEIAVQPVDISQLHMPKTVMIINLENYSHAKASDIRDDWKNIEKAMRFKDSLNTISHKRLMTSKTITRTMSSPSKNSSSKSKGQGVARVKAAPFSGKPIPARNMLLIMKRLIESQITMRETENTFKSTKRTFMRANRRDPDNINLPGKSTITHYRPDIHIYLDTSGSISEDQYRDAISNLIALTKIIDTNLYFTSFSHHVSQTTLLQTKNNSVNDIYKQFMLTPKVSGGTDFEHVWNKIELLDMINENSGKSYQLNFIITDFGYSLSRNQRWSQKQASVKYTYYLPVSVGGRSWDGVKSMASDFRDQMVRAGDTNVRARMIM